MVIGKVFLECLTLQVNMLRYFETSVTICHLKLYNIPVELNPQQNRCDNLKARIINFALGAYL
jgi:hypothetical protein